MKKIIHLSIIVAFLAFIPLSSRAAFYEPGLDIQTVKTQNFTIHYPVEAGAVAKDLMEISERVHGKLIQKFKWDPWGRTHIVLVDKMDQANGLTTVIPANYVLLYITPPEADSTLDNYKNYLELLFTHEYSHVLHIDQHFRMADPAHWIFGKIIAPNGLTPGWMREGIASYFESIETGRGRGHSSYTDMVLRNAVLSNKFPAIDEVDAGRVKWPGANTQYVYGVAFIKWLADKYGQDRIQKYMEEYASGLWLFSLNNKARRVFNKSFYKLWDEWKEDLKVKYTAQKTELEAKGLTPLTATVKKEEQIDYYTPSPTGGHAYHQSGNDEGSRVVVIPKPGAPVQEIKRGIIGQMAYSRDGKQLAFGSLSGIEPYNAYADVFVYDIEKKALRRVLDPKSPKKSFRAMDPDFAPFDGGAQWLVMVRTKMGTDNLYAYDLVSKKGYYLTQEPRWTQFSNPRFSPDGQQIVVSRRDHEGNRDIVLYSRAGKEIKKITNDQPIDNHPVWSPDGNFVYFESDRSGIPNIYRYNVAAGEASQVTNVLSGVYQPQVTPEGTMYVKYYTPKGSDAYQMAIGSQGSTRTMAAAGKSGYEALIKDNPVPIVDKVTIPGAKNYNAFPQVLVPRYVVPTFATLDDAYLFGFSAGRYDPMYRHSWNMFANYRTDANYLGAGGSYAYMRYNPSLFVGFARYALNWGRIFAGSNDEFFEGRLQGFVGGNLALNNHNISLSYFYEDRDNITDIPAGVSLRNLDRYAGIRSTYIYSRYKQFAESISQEDGPLFKLNVDFTNSVLGAADANEQVVAIGDLRYYFEMPWSDHHVLGLRSAAGWVWGDEEQIVNGSLRFGGPFGEGNLAGYSSRLFPFRGLPGVSSAGDRALLFSAEYRLPIATIERGIGTWPIYLRQIHASFFTDFGDIWARNGKDNVGFFDDFLLSVGAELKGDFVLGYGLPVTARLGYGIVVMNRWRVAGLEDSLFKQDLKNGSVYLQFGTAF